MQKDIKTKAGVMIEAKGLTKRYGTKLAVDDLSFTVQPGQVTGFLGPNGAGKSTTMRMILGLDQPAAGEVRIDGQHYRELTRPLRTVGALLDAKWVHPNRSARAHLRWMARSNGLPMNRVDIVLELVGLSTVAVNVPVGSRWACRSGWVLPLRCSVIRRCCYSMNRSTGWTPRASCGSGSSCSG